LKMAAVPLGESFNQWIQNLKVEIQQLSGDLRFMFVHRSKFTTFINDLMEIYKKLNTNETGNRMVSPTEGVHFSQIVALFTNLRNLMESTNEVNFLSTILNNEIDYMSQSLTDLRNEFNENIEALHIVEGEGLHFDKDQFRIDNYDDCVKIIERLDAMKLSNDKDEIKRKAVQEKLQTFIDSENISTNEVKTLSQEEFEAEMKDFDEWKKNHDDFIQQKRIGHGSYSEIYSGIDKQSLQTVSMKVMISNSLIQREFESFKREVTILSKLRHFAILPFIGYCSEYPYIIISELMTGGRLSDRIHDSTRPLDPTKQTIIALGIAHGMAYMHAQGMIHRDLKASSIFLDADDFPRISNFEVTKQGPDDNSLTGQLGSAAWTAPELFNSEQYSEKIDVYSFGVLLWELLTHDVPFRGLTPFMIVRQVTESHSRPLIPQNCPPKLAKLIKACWDQDPSRRPEFSKIAEILEKGEVSFPGTNVELVAAYINQVKGSKTNEELPENLELHLSNLIDKYIDGANTLFPEIFNLLLPGISHARIHELFETKRFIEQFLDYLEKCDSPSSATYIMNLLHEILIVNSELIEYFNDTTITSLIMSIFMRFGTTQTPFFTETLRELIHLSRYSFTSKNFRHLAPFLLASSIPSRQQITVTLTFIVKTKMFNKDTSLLTIIPNLTTNLIPETSQDLLLKSLELLEQLTSLDSVFSYIKDNDFIISVLPLCLHSQSDISSKAFSFIRNVLTKSIPTERFIDLFIESFHEYKLSPSADLSLQPLIVLSLLMKQDNLYEKFSNADNAITAFKHFLLNPDPTVLIYALRLAFSFISNEKSSQCFLKHVSTFMTLLHSPQESISSLSSACLTRLIITMNDNQIMSISTNDMAQYLNKSLSEEKNQNLVTAALRLAGSLSSNNRGADFLESSQCISRIANHLESKTKIHKTLATMIFASQSSQTPSSQVLLDKISTFSGFLDDPELCSYSIVFLGNIAVDPNAAILCMPSLSKIVSMIGAGKISNSKIFTAIHRIILTPEVYEKIPDSIIEPFLSKTVDLWDTPYSTAIFQIYDIFSYLQSGKNILIQQNLKAKVSEFLQKLPISHSQRPLLKRIISRLSH